MSKKSIPANTPVVVNGNVSPGESRRYDLGESNKQWRNIYARALIVESAVIAGSGGLLTNADKVDGFDASDIATPNTLLALDASAKLPADITGDANTLDGYDSVVFPRKAEDAIITGAWTHNNNITMGAGNTVDGVDVSTHQSRHLPSGADPLTTAIANTIVPDASPGIGAANSLARSDHTHGIVAAAPVTDVSPTSANAEGDATSFARSNHVHAADDSSNPGAAQKLLSTSAAGGVQLLQLGVGTAPVANNQITMIDAGTIGQAAGPLLTFNATGATLVLSPGKLGVGRTPTQVLEVQGSIKAIANTTVAMQVARYSDDSGPPQTTWQKARGIEAAPANVQDSDQTMSLLGYGYYGGSFRTMTQIVAGVDGVPVTTPAGRIRFLTAPDGGSLTEAVRITSDQRVGIGATGPRGVLEVYGTTADEQLWLAYDASNYATFDVGVTGTLEIDTTSDIILDPGGNMVGPGGSIQDDLGYYNRMWRTIFAAELYVERLVAQDVIATIGGRIMVTPTSMLATDLTNTDHILNDDFETPGEGSPDYFLYWIEVPGDGNVVADIIDPFTGTYCCLITAGASKNSWIQQNFSVTAGKRYYFEFYTRGDGTYAGAYGIYDVTNAAWIIASTSTLITGIEYAKVSGHFNAPAGCAIARLYLFNPGTTGGQARYDAVSIVDSFVDLEHNSFLPDDYFIMKDAPGGIAQTEVFKIISGPTGGGPYAYMVDRALGGPPPDFSTSPDYWYAGSATASLGSEPGEGYIELTSVETLYGHYGPNITMYIRKADPQTWDNVAPMISMGNLNSWLGYGIDEYGFAVGNDLLAADPSDSDFHGAVIDRTYGMRLFNTDLALYSAGVIRIFLDADVGIKVSSAVWGTDTTVFAAVFADDATVTSLDANDVIIGHPFHATAGSKRGVHWDDSANTLKIFASSTDYISLAGSGIEMYSTNKYFEVDSTGVLMYDSSGFANVTLTTAGVLTLGYQAGGEYITVQSTGISMYGGGTEHVKLTSAGVLTLGVIAGGEYIQVQSSGISVVAGGVERIGATGAGILTIKDSGGAAVFTFDASAGAEFTKPLTVATTGGIYQGTGTFAAPTTGLKIWNDTGVGRIAGYNAGILQWGATTDGILSAGGGTLTLDANGLSITGGETDPNMIRWTSGADTIMKTFGYVGVGSENYGYVHVYNDDDTNRSFLIMKAETYSAARYWANVELQSGSGTSSPIFRVNFDTAGDVTVPLAASTEYVLVYPMLEVGVGPGSSLCTEGIVVRQFFSDSEILALQSNDVAHTGTVIADTDTFGQFMKAEALAGGLVVRGLKDADGVAGYALTMQGALAENADTAKTTAGFGICDIAAGQIATNDWANVVADGNILSLRCMRGGSFVAVGLWDEDGDYYYDGALNNYDGLDDALIVQTAQQVLAGIWNDMLEQDRAQLVAMGVIHPNPDGKTYMISNKRLTALMMGAISQLYNKVKTLEQTSSLQLTG